MNSKFLGLTASWAIFVSCSRYTDNATKDERHANPPPAQASPSGGRTPSALKTFTETAVPKVSESEINSVWTGKTLRWRVEGQYMFTCLRLEEPAGGPCKKYQWSDFGLGNATTPELKATYKSCLLKIRHRSIQPECVQDDPSKPGVLQVMDSEDISSSCSGILGISTESLSTSVSRFTGEVAGYAGSRATVDVLPAGSACL